MTSATLQRPKWLSVKEVALRLGIHEQSVRRKIHAGEIPALQLGGPGCTLRVLENELERWLQTPAERRGPDNPTKPAVEPSAHGGGAEE